MFRLSEEQLRWKDLIENNDRILIFADRVSGKTTAMRTIQGNVVMFVSSYNEVKRLQREYNKDELYRKIMVFGESPCGLHPDILIFDDVLITKDNFEMFEQYFPMAKSKIIVIGTYHYWRIACLFKEIGVVYEN